MRKLLVTAVLAVALFTLSVGPLHAITFGELDGDGHPNVGAMVVQVPPEFRTSWADLAVSTAGFGLVERLGVVSL